MSNLDKRSVSATPDKKATHQTEGSVNYSNKFCTPNSIRARNGTFLTLPIVNTPTPPSRLRKIVNPFEIGLADRLHLPLIGSPSLFQRPPTPQLCSTQLEFEWTIDDVSSLNPANVEAHETQFQSVVDPEVEAKAQAAISSFFNEQVIAPSPDDCPLRDQKIILSSSISQPAKVFRDGYCQTELTLPPILPAEVEAALRPYFTFTQSQQQTPPIDQEDTVEGKNDASTIDHEAHEKSLHRKLLGFFGNSNDSSSISDIEQDVNLDSPAPQTPQMALKNLGSRRFLTPSNQPLEHKSPLNISLSPVKREAFGCISPISRDLTISSTKHQISQVSPLHEKSEANGSSLYRSTPDRTATIVRSMSMSDAVNSGRKHFEFSKRKSSLMDNDFSIARSSSESNMSYDDEMHLSQSSYGSQQHPCTPISNKSKRRKRSVSRKNLSLSFTSNTNDENMSVIQYTEAMHINMSAKIVE